MTLLILAALIWLGIHIGIAGTRLRDALVDPHRRRAVPRVVLAAFDPRHRVPGLGVECRVDDAAVVRAGNGCAGCWSR